MSDLKVTDRRWWARGENDPAPSEEPRLKPTLIEELEARLAAAGKLPARATDLPQSPHEIWADG